MTAQTAPAPVRIGRSDLVIPPLGLGANQFGGTIGAEESFAVLDAFVEGGGTHVDTADMYAHWVPGNRGGESETVIGEWMQRRGNRDAVVVGTKVGAMPGREGLAADNVARAADESLQRLRTDRIDLYWAHYDDPDTPLEEAVAAFDALVRAGKVRHVGLSNFTPERIEEWIRVAEAGGHALPVALQPRYNLVARAQYEREYAPVAQRHGLGVLPYAALAGGFLTGKYRTVEDTRGRAREQAVQTFVTEEGLAVVAALEEVAAAHRTTPGAVALAWQLTRPAIVAPLAGATRPEQVADHLAAVALRLADDELAALEEASRPFA